MSKYVRTHTESLVDKGANRGVVGEDTRAISTNPNKKVNICSIENHEIDSISIATADKVIKVVSREVIIILN